MIDDSVFNDKDKSVLVVVRWPVGGIRTFLNYVLGSFPGDDFQFHIIAVADEGVVALQDQIGWRVRSWTIVQSGKYEMISLISSVFRFLVNNNVQIIHAHGFSSCVASCLGAFFNSKPLILTSHDVLNKRQFNGVGGALKKFLLRFSFMRCKFIQSVSHDAQNNLISYFPGIRSKCLVIKNGIDGAKFYNAKVIDIRKEIGVDPTTVLVGFFGRFMAQKGFSVLTNAISILRESAPEYRFHVVCFGSGAFIREEKAELVRRGLDGQFSFIPFMSDVSGVMKNCDLIAMPSLWEACPLQPMEALCGGVPFVGSNCIGLREVIEDTPAFVVRVGDAPSLAEGILECLKSKRDIFENFAPIAVDRFDVARTSREIHALYKRATE